MFCYFTVQQTFLLLNDRIFLLQRSSQIKAFCGQGKVLLMRAAWPSVQNVPVAPGADSFLLKHSYVPWGKDRIHPWTCHLFLWCSDPSNSSYLHSHESRGPCFIKHSELGAKALDYELLKCVSLYKKSKKNLHHFLGRANRNLPWHQVPGPEFSSKLCVFS